MSNTAGDPQPQIYGYCEYCNTYHLPCPNNSNSFATVTYTVNYDAEILTVLKEILKKLEEIRMELP